MGQRGPRPRSAALKLLAGNPGKRPAQSGGSAMTPGEPERPAELVGEAAREWDRLIPELEAAGLLATVDRGILSAYCLAVADLLAAAEAINTHGRWLMVPIQNSKGDNLGERVIEHPAVKTQDKASARVKTLGAELGLTPAARLRLEGGGPSIETPQGNAVLAIRDRIQQARQS